MSRRGQYLDSYPGERHSYGGYVIGGALAALGGIACYKQARTNRRRDEDYADWCREQDFDDLVYDYDWSRS